MKRNTKDSITRGVAIYSFLLLLFVVFILEDGDILRFREWLGLG